MRSQRIGHLSAVILGNLIFLRFGFTVQEQRGTLPVDRLGGGIGERLEQNLTQETTGSLLSVFLLSLIIDLWAQRMVRQGYLHLVTTGRYVDIQIVVGKCPHWFWFNKSNIIISCQYRFTDQAPHLWRYYREGNSVLRN